MLFAVSLLEEVDTGKLAAVFGTVCGAPIGGAAAVLSADCLERLLDFDSLGDSGGRNLERQ